MKVININNPKIDPWDIQEIMSHQSLNQDYFSILLFLTTEI